MHSYMPCKENEKQKTLKRIIVTVVSLGEFVVIQKHFLCFNLQRQQREP